MKNEFVCTGTMKLLGDYYTLRIIDALKYEEQRFCELQRTLENVNPTTLTKRLKKLEDAELIHRSEEEEDKVAVVYSLTRRGQDTLPIIRALYKFSADS